MRVLFHFFFCFFFSFLLFALLLSRNSLVYAEIPHYLVTHSTKLFGLLLLLLLEVLHWLNQITYSSYHHRLKILIDYIVALHETLSRAYELSEPLSNQKKKHHRAYRWPRRSIFDFLLREQEKEKKSCMSEMKSASLKWIFKIIEHILSFLIDNFFC